MTDVSISDYFRAHQNVVHECLPILRETADQVAAVLIEALRSGHKILAFGNGGSAAQASHLAAELMGRFEKTREPLPCLALVSDPAVLTCISNDFGYGTLFERQIAALALPGDVALGISTSGQSENVRRGLAKARERRATTVALSGMPGFAEGEAEYVLRVPSTSVAHIQEIHLMLLHAWCRSIDQAFTADHADRRARIPDS